MKIPKITLDFVEYLKNAKDKTVRVKDLKISVFGSVFPPASAYSASTRRTYDALSAQLGGKQVLDIGTGSGVLGLLAALCGACVDAIDCDSVAVSCAAYNSIENNLPMKVWQSDMFASVPPKKYDLLIANLPILPHKHDCVALFDSGYRCHNELFAKGANYLAPNAPILMTTANLVPTQFSTIEQLAMKHYFVPTILSSEKDLGYVWRTYFFSQHKQTRGSLT